MSFLLWPESHSPTFPLRKCKEFQPSTEGVDRRARRSHRYRGGGHKTLLAVSVLAPGASVLPVKLWGSYGCNEVVGTQVAITAQLNCHQHLMEAQDQTLLKASIYKYPQKLRYPLDMPQHFKSRLQVCGLCETSSIAVELYVPVTWPVWRKLLWC